MVSYGDAYVFFLFIPGYVCNRTSVDAHGCCHVKKGSKLTSKHRCDTCSKNDCCVVYEYCVACCLKPDKVSSFFVEVFPT